MGEKKRTFYDVLREELNISPEDTPDVIVKNLKKSVDDEISSINAKKNVYDTETNQSVKKIKSNVDSALSAIKKIAASLPPVEEPAPEEEIPVEEPVPEEEAPPEDVGPVPPDQLPAASKLVKEPKAKAYSKDTMGKDKLEKAGIKENSGVKINEPVSKKKGKELDNTIAQAAQPAPVPAPKA